MPIVQKTVRTAAITLAVLFAGLSLFGMVGVWWVEQRAAEAARKAFGVIASAVGIADAGFARVDELIAASREEVRQAAETITAVGTRAEVNSPVLGALLERLETRLAPRLARIQQALAPVRDAVATIGNVVNLLNSLPMMADRAPRVAALDETLQRFEELSADTAQLRGTLRALVGAPKSELTAEAVDVLHRLTQRIDARLGEAQASVQAVRAEVAALQARLDRRLSRLLFVFTLLAALATLMLAWVLYSQAVVIRHYRR
jgi:molybdopterin converting factor small subunit